LFGPILAEIFTPTADDDKLGSLMVIYSGYSYFRLPLVFLSSWSFHCLFAGNRKETKEKKRKKEDV
jgi:hypothetical protein